MLAFTGDHYKLITYKNISAFSFTELPFNIKKLISIRCMEKGAGPYSLIPDMNNFNEKEGIQITNIIEEINDSSLYNENIVLQYYSKSADKPLPGKGSGEKIDKENSINFTELANIPKWRKKLSNMWEEEFSLDGKKWLTVENYYQGAKFKHSNPGIL